MTINNVNLQPLGIDNKTAAVYLSALEAGPSSLQKIAKGANLPRSSCYLLIEQLKKMGLISQTKIGKKTIFTPTAPDQILKLAQEQKNHAEKFIDEINHFLPQLKAIYNQQPNKPNVRFYEGFEGIKTILEETLHSQKILVFCSGYQNQTEKKLDEYLKYYFEKIVKNKINTFELIGSSYDADEYQKKYNSSLNQIKIVKSDSNLNHIDKMIFDQKIATISYEYLNGVILEDSQIANYEEFLFWQLWNQNH